MKKQVGEVSLWNVSTAMKRLTTYNMEERTVIVKKVFIASFLEKLLRINIDEKIWRKINTIEK